MFEIGEWIGGTYQLKRLLGRGGMSYVFEAFDAHLSRMVAIKVGDDREESAPTLIREARALAAVRHDGLPAIHGIGVHRGWTYLVLERLYGIDLERHLETTGRIAPDTAVPLLASIADVLAAVHRHGIAHRDLKPGNVMLCGKGRVALLDFGIVLPEVDAATMARCGTPRYLAPEVIAGSVAPGRAHLVDVYAFGAMAFEVLAGHPPFDAATLIDLLDLHLHAPVPELARVPAPLAQLVRGCLAKRPDDRPHDMEAIACDLRGFARRAPSGSGPVRAPATIRETYRHASMRPRGVAPAPTLAQEVLIVEDDEDIRDALAQVLAGKGFRTRVASNGREAIELMHGGCRPGVILLDLMMPRLDGQGFLESQLEDPALVGVPVVLVTAQNAERALRYSTVRGVVPKPFALPTLITLIEQLLQSP